MINKASIILTLTCTVCYSEQHILVLASWKLSQLTSSHSLYPESINYLSFSFSTM